MGELGRRYAAFGLVLAGTFGSAYAFGEKLPGHSHTHVMAMGYQLSPEADGRFTIRDPQGEAVTRFTVQHQALIHLIAVRPDLSTMIHTHPAPAADGSFAVDLPDAGPWEVHAEGEPVGMTGAMVSVSIPVGADRPFVRTALPAASDVATVSVAGDDIRVTRDGSMFMVAAPRHTEPFLGSPAHLLAFRVSDNAFTHLHPTSGGSDHFTFDLSPLGSGTFRLFLQFGYAGQVATVPMVVRL